MGQGAQLDTATELPLLHVREEGGRGGRGGDFKKSRSPTLRNPSPRPSLRASLRGEGVNFEARASSAAMPSARSVSLTCELEVKRVQVVHHAFGGEVFFHDRLSAQAEAFAQRSVLGELK